MFQKNPKKKIFLKPKELESFIKNKIAARQKDGGFSLVKLEPDNAMFEKYENKQFKRILGVLRERIEEQMPNLDGCFAQMPEGNILIYLDKAYSEAELSEVGWQIVSQCCAPLENNYAPIYPEVNAGLAIFPDSGKSYEALNDSLNIAVVVSKTEGSNTFSVYTPKLTAEKSKEYKQLAGLKDGLNRKQFLLYYQPIIDLHLGTVCGAEALLRWNHPIHGIVPTRNFFDEIEASGEIYTLGLWTFEQLLSQCRRWHSSFLPGRMIYNINLSAKQLIHESLADDIKRIAKKYSDVSPGEICFEVSGVTSLLRDEIIMNNVSVLSKAGFHFAIDNFTEAHLTAELHLLRPLDFIKFSADCHKSPEERAQIADLVRKGSLDGICFVAEGIENQQMLECARTLGIPRAQGFYFCRPLPAEECLNVMLAPVWRI